VENINCFIVRSHREVVRMIPVSNIKIEKLYVKS
jgi:hypothetical protein